MRAVLQQRRQHLGVAAHQLKGQLGYIAAKQALLRTLSCSQRVDRFDDDIAHILGGTRQAGLTSEVREGLRSSQRSTCVTQRPDICLDEDERNL